MEIKIDIVLCHGSLRAKLSAIAGPDSRGVALPSRSWPRHSMPNLDQGER
jgi:hypothetical protein